MSYTVAVDHLYARGLELAPDPSAPHTRRKFDLEHMRILARALGNPQDRFPSILIAGTNGKGSTAATLAGILTAAGYRTGLYTSPHLSRVNERIRIDGQPISDEDFARLYFQVDAAAEQLVTSGQLPQHPSFFETLTALAFLYFAEPPIPPQNGEPHPSESQQNRVPHLRGEAAKVGSQDAPGDQPTPDQEDVTPQVPPTPTQKSVILSEALSKPEASRMGAVEGSTVLWPSHNSSLATDIVILEVGLGGRLDATNIVEPLLSLITDISLDHQDYLGNTIAEITREKAGILRHRGTLITLPQHPEANQAIGEAAAALDLHAINAAQYIPTADKLLHPNHARHSERSEESLYSTTASPDETPVQAKTSSMPGAPSSAPKAAKVGHSSEARTDSPIHYSDPELVEGEESLYSTATPPAKTPAPAQASSSATIGSVKGTALAVPHSEPQNEGASAPEVLLRNCYTVTLAGQPLHVDSPLAGQHQQRNIALAIAAAEELRNPTSYKYKESNDKSYKITNAQMEQGIRQTQWPGRLELLPLPGSAPILLDVAHNPAGAWTLRAALAQLPEEMPRTLLFSCLRDKDLREMSQILLPLFDRSSPDRPNDHVVLAPIDSPRAASLEDLAAAAHDLEITAEITASLKEALIQARKLTPRDGLIVATGSVYLIGTLRTLILANP